MVSLEYRGNYTVVVFRQGSSNCFPVLAEDAGSLLEIIESHDVKSILATIMEVNKDFLEIAKKYCGSLDATNVKKINSEEIICYFSNSKEGL